MIHVIANTLGSRTCRRRGRGLPTYLYCGVIAVLMLMHIKYEGYGLWPVSESHGGGCTPPLEHTRSITKGEALAPACKASGAGALTGRSSPSSAEHTRAVILHYRTYGRYHISSWPTWDWVAIGFERDRTSTTTCHVCYMDMVCKSATCASAVTTCVSVPRDESAPP